MSEENSAEHWKNKYLELNQVSGQLCDKCSWAMKFPEEPCRCELQQLADEQDLTIRKLGGILRKIAEVIKEPPADNEMHSWHDLPELVKGMKNSYHALQVQFINSWSDCHDGSDSACSKNHDED